MKEKWLKVLGLFVMISIVAFIFYGCGIERTQSGSSAVNEDSSAEATEEKTTEQSVENTIGQEPVELTYWQIFRHDESLKDMEAVTSRYSEQFPGITINVEEIATADIANKVQTAIMAQSQPDILREFIGRQSTYMHANLLASLDDIFTEEYKAKFFDDLLKIGMLNGKMLIFPESYYTYGAVINKTLFKEAGAENLLPQNPDRIWTREEFVKAITAVSKNGVYGTTLWAASEQSDIDTKTLIEGGKGASFFNEEGTKILYDSQRTIDGLKWLISLADKKLVPPNVQSMVDDDGWNLFAQKKVAVIFTNLWCRVWIQDKIKKGEIKEPFEIMLAQYPNIAGDTPKTAMPLTGYSIFNKGDESKVKSAKEFLKYLIEQPEVVKAHKKQSEFPALKTNSNIYAGDSELDWISNTLPRFAYDPGLKNKDYQEIRMVLFPEIQAAFSKAKQPEGAMKDFTNKANDILSKQK